MEGKLQRCAELLFRAHTSNKRCRVSLTVATREKEYDLEWITEWEIKALKEKVKDPERSGRYIAITPDSYFVIITSSKKICFFL